MFFFASGLNEIQELTKQSLRNKPFCLAVGKEWEEKQRKMDLRDIHTNLSWSRKHRKASGFKQTELNDITQILSEEQLGEDGPVRILVQGRHLELTLASFINLNQLIRQQKSKSKTHGIWYTVKCNGKMGSFIIETQVVFRLKWGGNWQRLLIS